MEKSDEIEFKSKLNQAKTASERADIYLDRLSKLDSKQVEEKSEILKQALELKDLSISKKVVFVNAQVSILNRAGLVQEGHELCLSFLSEITNKELHPIEYVRICTNLILFKSQIGLPHEAVSLGEEVMLFLQSINKPEVYAISNELYRLTGSLAGSVGEVEKAIEFLEKGMKIVEQYHKNEEGLVLILGSLGDVCNESKDFKKAFHYYQRGTVLSKEFDLKYITPIFQRMLGEVSVSLKQYEDAEEHFNDALIALDSINDAQALAQVLINLAKLRLIDKNWVRFKTLSNQLIETPYFKSNENFRAEYYALQSQYLLQIGSFNDALEYANKYEDITLKIKDLNRNRKVFELKIEVYKVLKDYRSVVAYYEKLYEVSNAIVNESNRKLLEGFQAKYQNEKKEKEIQELKLVSVSSQLQSLRAQLNPHFVFNAIGCISQDLKKSNIEQSKELLRSFARLIKNNLEFAKYEKISLKEEIEFLTDYLSLEQNRLGDKLLFEIECATKLYDVQIPSMIVQPYLENAIKHGITPLNKTGVLGVRFSLLEEKIKCEITDNGVGRKQAAANKVHGFHLGKSTSINAKRLRLLNQNEQDNLHVEYHDLMHENGHAAGTRVVLLIKS